MNIYHPSEMSSCDKATLTKENIRDFELMKRAADAAYEKLIRSQLLSKQDSIGLIAGLGNNGGDGIIIAENLKKNGYDITVYLIGESYKRSEALNQAIERYEQYGDPIAIEDEAAMKTMKESFKSHAVFIDALFGIGLSKPLKGVFELAVNMVNTTGKKIIAVDIPSGLSAENGLVLGSAIKASHTLVIQNYKIGNLINDAADYNGTCLLVDVGIEQLELKPSKRLIDENIVIPKRKNNTHKYDYGSVLVVGGTRSMEGAPILSASAAMKAGAGLVSIAFDHRADLHKTVPLEIMSFKLKENESLDAHLNRKSAVIFGVGLGKETPEYTNILRTLIRSKVPLLIDADGLNYLKPLLEESLDFSTVLITPHIGEMARLLDTKSHLIKKDSLQAIQSLTQKGLTVLLKGPCTIIGNAQTIIFAPFPNPGLAKAGSGDVLSGLIAAFMKSHTLIEAAQIGVTLQAKTAHYCKKEYGENAFLPTDIIKHLPESLKMLQ